LFQGTIRYNLDPFKAYSEKQLFEALNEVEMKEFVQALPKKLDTDLSTIPLAVGQKQLLALARIFLRDFKMLILDEELSGLDLESYQTISKKILERFQSSTILTIAHRMTALATYDKILVIRQGEAVEFDVPFKLLVKNENDMVVTSTGPFASLVNQMPKLAAEIFFFVCREKYFHEKLKQESSMSSSL